MPSTKNNPNKQNLSIRKKTKFYNKETANAIWIILTLGLLCTIIFIVAVMCERQKGVQSTSKEEKFYASRPIVAGVGQEVPIMDSRQHFASNKTLLIYIVMVIVRRRLLRGNIGIFRVAVDFMNAVLTTNGLYTI